MELESLNSTSQTSSSNQEQNACPTNLPSLKEARKVAIIIGVVIFLGIGYVARFTLTIDETISVGYNLLVRYVGILDYIITSQISNINSFRKVLVSFSLVNVSCGCGSY